MSKAPRQKRKGPQREKESAPREISGNIIYGRNAVTEALKSERTIDRILFQQDAGGSISKIVEMAKDGGVRFDFVRKSELDAITEGAHQGVVCISSPYEYKELSEIIENASSGALVIILDGLEDPHNLGAIMRSAECVGADGIIIPKRRSVGLTETVAKTSAGAIEYMPCARVGNIVKAIEELKEAGFWIYGADMDGETLWDSKLEGKIALVIGNEGKGISRLVKEKCDFILSIPMKGKINSLNASNAATVLMYEVLRQRG